MPDKQKLTYEKKRPKKYRKNMSFSTTPDVSTLGMPAKKHHTLRQTNIAMGNPPFEDVSPIKKKVNFYCYVSLPEGIAKWGQNLLPKWDFVRGEGRGSWTRNRWLPGKKNMAGYLSHESSWMFFMTG